MISVTMRDETATRREVRSVVLEDVPEKITFRERIRLRVRGRADPRHRRRARPDAAGVEALLAQAAHRHRLPLDGLNVPGRPTVLLS